MTESILNKNNLIFQKIKLKLMKNSKKLDKCK